MREISEQTSRLPIEGGWGTGPALLKGINGTDPNQGNVCFRVFSTSTSSFRSALIAGVVNTFPAAIFTISQLINNNSPQLCHYMDKSKITDLNAG